MDVNTIGWALTLVVVLINVYRIIQRLKRIENKQNFQTAKILLTMSLQDQILAALAGLGVDFDALGTNLTALSADASAIATGVAKLLENSGIDGSAILASLSAFKDKADTLAASSGDLKTALDSVVTTLNPPAAGSGDGQPATQGDANNAQG